MLVNNPKCDDPRWIEPVKLPVGAAGAGQELAGEGVQIGRPEEDQIDGAGRPRLGAFVEGDWQSVSNSLNQGG